MRYPLVEDLLAQKPGLHANPASTAVLVDLAGDSIVEIRPTGSEYTGNPPAGTEGHRAGSPAKALELAGLPRMAISDVMRMTLEEAHARLIGFLEPLVGMTVGGRKIAAYETPRGMADALLGQNYKTAKQAPPGESPSEVQGLALLPADKLHHYRELDQKGEVRELVERELGDLRMRTLCAGSNADCRAACLVFAGRNASDIYNTRRKAALTVALLQDPQAFCRMLVEAVARHGRSAGARGLVPFVRLNVLSDIPWELVLPGLFHRFAGDIRFYDYTKVPGRAPPAGYDLTFSFSGTNQQLATAELERGRRVAVVFLGMRRRGEEWVPLKRGAPLPSSFWGRPVVDGDVSDLRPLDPPGCIVGLRWKSPRGSLIDPAASPFVQPAFVVDGNGPAPRSNPDAEYLVVPVTPPEQPIYEDA